MKKQTGITLIALVITIIILLILAGTSIGMLFSENGVISRAEEAAMKTVFSRIVEEFDLYVGERVIENFNFNSGTLNAYAQPNSLSYNTKTEEGGDIYSIFSNDLKKDLVGFEITNGVLFYSNENKKIEKWAQECGIRINPYEVTDEGVLVSATVNRDLLEGATGTLTIPTTIKGITVVEVGEGTFGRLEGVEHIILPDTVKVIKKQAFRNNTSITSITLPNGLQKIEDYAFQGCTSLKSIEIPDSVTEMGEYVFRDCSSLASVKLSSGLKILKTGLFQSCNSLIEVEVPQGVIEIGAAFSTCKNLTTIKIPASVTKLSDRLATSSTKLSNIIIDPANTSYKYTDGFLLNAAGTEINLILESALSDGKKTLRIPKGVVNLNTSIGYGTVQKIILPSTVQKVLGDVFSSSPVNTIILEDESGNSVTKTAYLSYENGQLCDQEGKKLYYCALLNNETVVLNESIESIEQGAFYRCNKVKKVIFPQTLTTLKNFALRGLQQVQSLDFSANLTKINPYAFYDVNCPVTISDIGTSQKKFTAENNGVYSLDASGNKYKLIGLYNKNMTTFTIPDGVKEIEIAAFYYLSKLETIILPQSLQKIGMNAFRGCSGLKTIEIPSSVTSIGTDVFMHCTAIQQVKIHKAKDSITGSPWGLDIGFSGIVWEE